MTRTLVRRAMLAGALFATVALLGGCGSDGRHGSMPSGTAATTGSTAHNNADVMFAAMMIPHHQQAVQMATLAPSRARDGEVKTLAAQILAAQQPEIQTMTAWLTTWGTSMPAMTGDMDMGGMGHGATMSPGMMPEMMSDADMAALTAANGTDFDKQFCHLMIAHHQGAITMARNELAQGANAAAKTMAQEIITAQQAEIDAMNAILARL
jgi:uncharacterized protein (DUF305 family)